MAVTRPRSRRGWLAEAIGLGPEELAMRKRFLEFGDDDVRRLEGMYDLRTSMSTPSSRRSTRPAGFPETAAFFRDPRLLEHVKGPEEYFIRLTQGDYESSMSTTGSGSGASTSGSGSRCAPSSGCTRSTCARSRRCSSRSTGRSQPGDRCVPLLDEAALFRHRPGVDTDIYSESARSPTSRRRSGSSPRRCSGSRDRLLVLPIIGILDTSRAQKLTEGLLREHPREPRQGRDPGCRRRRRRSTRRSPTTCSRPSRRRG